MSHIDFLWVEQGRGSRISNNHFTRDAVASRYPTAKEARITWVIVDAAAKVRDLNFKYLAEGKGATLTARFGPDSITLCDPNRASEGAEMGVSEDL